MGSDKKESREKFVRPRLIDGKFLQDVQELLDLTEEMEFQLDKSKLNSVLSISQMIMAAALFTVGILVLAYGNPTLIVQVGIFFVMLLSPVMWVVFVVRVAWWSRRWRKKLTLVRD
jgi:hypothetical protein